MASEASLANTSISNCMQNANVSDTMTISFINMMTQFLEAMHDVFPECPKVAFYALGWTAKMNQVKGDKKGLLALGREAMDAYVESMSPYFSMCLAKDPAILNEDIDIMNNIAIRDKWSDELDQETKNTFWQYIQHLNEFANMRQMCSALPTSAIEVAQGMASDIAAKIERGDMALSDVSIPSLLQEVSSRVNAEEIASSISVQSMGDPSVICAMMASMMSSMNM